MKINKTEVAMIIMALITILLIFLNTKLRYDKGSVFVLNGDFYKRDSMIVKSEENLLTISNSISKVVYNLNSGLIEYLVNDSKVISNIYSEVKIERSSVLKTIDYNRKAEEISISELSDGFGKGVKVAVINHQKGMPTINQNFYVYEGISYIFIDAAVEGEGVIKTNYIAPVVSEVSKEDKNIIHFKDIKDRRFLFIPFDNDRFVRFASYSVKNAKESYEVTSIFDNDSRKGVVIGSVTHDTWKTGLKPEADRDGNLVKLTVYGGAAKELTRDSIPHGFVSGKSITSPRIFIGLYDDYREGLEEYGMANAVIAPPLKWDGGVPVGWNSWAAVADKLSYSTYNNTSDFVKDNLQYNNFNNNGIVYINFDSFWTNLTEEQILDSVKHVHANGQKAGIYWSPFTYWGGGLDKAVEGTDYKYTYNEILLRDNNGKILPELDGGLPIDPTHPATIMRIDWQMKRFVEWGFDYVKLDFLSHASMEGNHFEKRITTGIQAYNYGMNRIKNALDPAVIGRPFFISLSIAPIFPHQYGHSRRVSCDAFGAIDQTEYMLNSLTYGWWQNDTIYKYNDPDHIVLYKSYNYPPTEENEAESRFNAAVIGGTVLLNSDDFNFQEARNRAVKYLTNSELNKIALDGITFVPVEGNTGEGACDLFVRKEDKEKCTYVAVFNYSDKEVIKNIDLKRIGLEDNRVYKFYDLWDKTTVNVQDKFELKLEGAKSRIFKVY